MGQKHPKFLTCWFHKWSDLLTNLALATTIPMLIVTAQQAPEIPRFEMGHPVCSSTRGKWLIPKTMSLQLFKKSIYPYGTPCTKCFCIRLQSAKLMFIFYLLCRSEQYRDDVHQGLYRCRARNRLGTILSRLVRVNAGKQLFQGIISFQHLLSRRNSLFGDFIFL